MKIHGLSQSLVDTVRATLNEKTGDKEAYQKFFQGALKKFGVSSPEELEGDKKKEFFDYVDKNWKSDDEEAGKDESTTPEGDELDEAKKKKLLTKGMDTNGNSVVKIKTPEGSFSIQTNGNLPTTHRKGVGDHTNDEVKKYITKHGSDKQKRIVKLYM